MGSWKNGETPQFGRLAEPALVFWAPQMEQRNDGAWGSFGQPTLNPPHLNSLSMKYYIIAGEASGDLHGSNLIKALKKEDPQADIRCWGGDLMQAAGGTLVKHYKELAFMGFIEVLFNLKTILRNITFCKANITAFAPDAIIFIDYPGFNMRIAQWAKTKGIPTH